MRRRLPVLLAVICLATDARAAEAPPGTLVFIKAGRALDVRAGRYLERQGILVEGDRIKEVGPLARRRRIVAERRHAGSQLARLAAARHAPRSGRRW
jgi:hypothetical protein